MTMCRNGLHDITRPGTFRKGGHGCVECGKARSRESSARHQAKANAIMQGHKMAVGCAQCGYCENVAALQFDHIVPRGSVARTGGDWTLPHTVAAALRLIADPNVRVLCANCHAIKSAADRLTIRGLLTAVPA